MFNRGKKESMMMVQTTDARLSTGVSGLDEILHGGLQPGRAYLVSGGPGGGKKDQGKEVRGL